MQTIQDATPTPSSAVPPLGSELASPAMPVSAQSVVLPDAMYKLDEVGINELETRYRRHGCGLTAAQLRQTRAPLGTLQTAPRVFQPRNFEQEPWVKQQHIDVLTRAAREQDRLDHITVLPVASIRVVVDGHCRLAAYHKAGWEATRLVPVRHFCGSFSDALKLSASANSKDRLSLTRAEKTERAWQLVLYNEARQCYSVRDIAAVAAVGKSTVANMVRTLTKTPEFDPRELTWSDVKRRRRGDQEIDREWEERLIRAWANRLRRGFGPKPDSQPEIFADALETAYPRLLKFLADRLVRECTEENPDF